MEYLGGIPLNSRLHTCSLYGLKNSNQYVWARTTLSKRESRQPSLWSVMYSRELFYWQWKAVSMDSRNYRQNFWLQYNSIITVLNQKICLHIQKIFFRHRGSHMFHHFWLILCGAVHQYYITDIVAGSSYLLSLGLAMGDSKEWSLIQTQLSCWSWEILSFSPFTQEWIKIKRERMYRLL